MCDYDMMWYVNVLHYEMHSLKLYIFAHNHTCLHSTYVFVAHLWSSRLSVCSKWVMLTWWWKRIKNNINGETLDSWCTILFYDSVLCLLSYPVLHQYCYLYSAVISNFRHWKLKIFKAHLFIFFPLFLCNTGLFMMTKNVNNHKNNLERNEDTVWFLWIHLLN